MYPRIKVNKEKLRENAKILFDMCKSRDILPFAVVKGVCADPVISQIIVDQGFEYLADSRIENIESLQHINCKKVLLRLPMMSEIKKVVELVDISLNSELETLRLLNEEAIRQNKKHKVILMFDLGDLREGFFCEHGYEECVGELRHFKNIEIFGVGVNLTCYGGVIPNEENLSKLIKIRQDVESLLNIKIPYISGGNSSTVHMITKNTLPNEINNLRIGESILLGTESAYQEMVPNAKPDVFTLEAQVIEVKYKPSKPIGNIGLDAFGNVPDIKDKGMMMRAICAIGRQEVVPSGLSPINPNIEIMGASSDHLIIDVTNTEVQLGDIIQFNISYGVMLQCFTSKYVKKVYE